MNTYKTGSDLLWAGTRTVRGYHLPSSQPAETAGCSYSSALPSDWPRTRSLHRLPLCRPPRIRWCPGSRPLWLELLPVWGRSRGVRCGCLSCWVRSRLPLDRQKKRGDRRWVRFVSVQILTLTLKKLCKLNCNKSLKKPNNRILINLRDYMLFFTRKITRLVQTTKTLIICL